MEIAAIKLEIPRKRLTNAVAADKLSGQRSAVSGQRSAVSGQRSAVSGQRYYLNPVKVLHNSHQIKLIKILKRASIFRMRAFASCRTAEFPNSLRHTSEEE
jgi:hypothetical protein